MTDISPDRVKAQLKRILSGSDFKAGKRLSQFLRYVVEHSLNGQSDSIKQYTIAVEVLGHKADFDPISNPAVRILARRLRRALDQYYSSQGFEDPIRIDMPKGGYTPVFLANHPAPESLRSDECQSSDAVQVPLDFSNPAIAVIMFDCLNNKEQFGYVATGLTEEIIIALTRFPNFLVVGPLSRGVIHEQNMELSGIGQKYGVRFVLDGTMRTHDQMLRLTFRLADAVSGKHLWAQAFDCRLQDDSIMECEKNVVGQVVATIADNCGIIPRFLTEESLTRNHESPDVYEAVLRYYHHFRILTQESFVNAMNALEKAVRNNPDHALATAALGDLVASSYLFGYDEAESVLTRAEALGRKSVALVPNCQTARFTMALIHFLKFQRTSFLDEVEQAIQINPNNAHYIAGVSLHLGMVGEWDRAMKLMKKAMRLNPHYPGWYHVVAFMNYYLQSEYDPALIEARRFNTPEFFWDPLIRAAVLGQLDRQTDAGKAVDELLTLVPDFKRRGKRLIRRLAYLDEHVEMLRDGLCKAGLRELS